MLINTPLFVVLHKKRCFIICESMIYNRNIDNGIQYNGQCSFLANSIVLRVYQISEKNCVSKHGWSRVF